ncbi:transcriptional regulator [Aldersonia kunmingensis]|uniref:transcriptional regulator n=1 Tax=Aldersonia kunmingensis TaxID=408066 RepID=UPI000835F044|nr:transcriptional regulator [Aldersonia kunmingensis]
MSYARIPVAVWRSAARIRAFDGIVWSCQTSYAAAAQLGFSGEYLRLIEVGKRTPALGQMRKFLSVYGADGAVEPDPHGSRQDLILFDPINDDGDPIFVEFNSRIREARRLVLGGPLEEEEDWQETPHEPLSQNRAAELGVVVALLTRADDKTLRKVRKFLEDHLG